MRFSNFMNCKWLGTPAIMLSFMLQTVACAAESADNFNASWKAALGNLTLGSREQRRISDYVEQYESQMQSSGEGADPAASLADEQQLVEEIENVMIPAHRFAFERDLLKRRWHKH